MVSDQRVFVIFYDSSLRLICILDVSSLQSNSCIIFLGALALGPPVYGTPTVIPVSGPSNSRMEHDNYSSPVTSQPITRKKRSSEAVTEAPAAEKKTRSKLTSRKLTTQGRFSSFLCTSFHALVQP